MPKHRKLDVRELETARENFADMLRRIKRFSSGGPKEEPLPTTHDWISGDELQDLDCPRVRHRNRQQHNGSAV